MTSANVFTIFYGLGRVLKKDNKTKFKDNQSF